MKWSFHIIQGMLFEDVKLQAHERGLANVSDLDSKEQNGWLDRSKTCDNLHKLHTSGKRASAYGNSCYKVS
jgi:hypothetical protein